MIDLQFDHVTKIYRLRQDNNVDQSAGRLVRKMNSLWRPKQEFYAVRDVSFAVERGEALGIIGHNGAGKSTILKLLSNIITPTSGEIKVNGRLAALIEVGSGFHPELTGRENIYLNGSILGMRRREITAKLDSIIDFAGVREFIDTPVKRFSSGMYVRLGFSIAAHLDPDILLLDEVLAVGDAAFQATCLDRIKKLEQAGTTIVFISHDLSAVERLCNRVLLLRKGEIVANGAPAQVIRQYQNQSVPLLQAEQPQSTGRFGEINTLTFRDAEGQKTTVFRTGEPLTASVEYTAHAPIEDAVFEILFYTSHDRRVHSQFTTEVSGDSISLNPGKGTVEFFCPEMGLLPNIYCTDINIKKRGAAEPLCWQYQSTMLRIDPGKIVRGYFYLPHQWKVTPENQFNGGASFELQTLPTDLI